MFVNDGSRDATWKIICDLAERSEVFCGISLSRNRGHQNAVLAGLMEAKDRCDITVSIDCDGQDDINAVDEMVRAYCEEGCEIVYGVRSKRDTDTFFKRFTAESFYHLLNWMGVEAVFNHADYRLISSRALQELAKFKEVNIFLRGMVPLVGFKSTSVYYERHERIAGESHYPLAKMLALAFEGDHKPEHSPAENDHGNWRPGSAAEFCGSYMVDSYISDWGYSQRMGQHGVHHVLYRRNSADLPGNTGRSMSARSIGDEGKAQIYRWRANGR